MAEQGSYAGEGRGGFLVLPSLVVHPSPHPSSSSPFLPLALPYHCSRLPHRDVYVLQRAQNLVSRSPQDILQNSNTRKGGWMGREVVSA